MNNFIFDEMLANEYRKDRLTEAKNINLVAKLKNNSISLSWYKSLASLGTKIENLGAKLETHYNCLVVREKRSILSNVIK